MTLDNVCRPSAAGTPRKRFPDFFIVGQPKSGTTALYEMLRRHPQIYMPDEKEPHFFVTDAHYRNVPETIDDYLRLFDAAKSHQRIGEASASYLWSRDAACGIAAVQPAAQIIAILREPASLLRSFHLQMLESYIETEKSLQKALSLEDARRRGRHVPRSASDQQQLLFYSDHVRYVDQLRRYHELFPPEPVMVLIYDDFRRDNEGTLRTVLRFLGVDDTFPLGTAEANPTVRVRSPRLHQLVHAVSVGERPAFRAVKGGVKALTPRRLRLHALRATQDRIVSVNPRPPDDRLMIELRRRFKPEVVALSKYLDRDLVVQWGYESPG